VQSRIGYAMALDGTAPRPLGQLSTRLGTPVASILAVSAITLAYIAVGDFGALLGMFTFSVWPFYALTAVAMLRLRRRGVGEPLAWRAPGGAVPALVVCATALFMTVALLRDPDQRERSLMGLAVIAAFGVFYALWRRRRRG
jgi:amino acid transporter